MDKDIVPKVTVIMPVYNAAPFLKEAVESILSQTYRDFELLIINDGSTDNSLDILEQFNDPRIRIIRNERNLGIIKSQNKGVEHARGEYIAKMDADDISMPSRLQKQVAFLDEHPEVVLIASRIILIDAVGKEQGVWPEEYNCISINQIKQTLPRMNCIAHPTVMIRSNVLKRIRYNESFLKSEDWGLWLEMLSGSFILAKLEEVLLYYRVHSESITVKANAKGVQKKGIKFKFKYLKYKMGTGSMRGTDYAVLSSFFIDVMRFSFQSLMPGFYALSVKIYKTDFLKLFKQFREVNKQLSDVKLSFTHLFFFPYYHTGGAEKVHVSILESVADKKPLVFITGISNGNAYVRDFKKHATVLEVFYLIQTGFTERWLMKKIQQLCNLKKVVLFGCNSRFFYSLIPHLPIQATIMDMVHAFVHSYEDGPEKWSIPVVSRISKRVVINLKTRKDFEELYMRHSIPGDYVKRIIYIPNYTEIKNVEKKDIDGNLVVLFAGRGSEEKRIHIVSRLARLSAENHLPLEFHFAGEVKDYIPPDELKYCILHGEISNEQAMEAIYNKAHFLVLTSSREGFPMVIMEAMMQGVIPVSTNVGGIAEHISDHINGFLIQGKEESEIEEKILEIFKYFADHRNEMQKISLLAREYALQHFRKENFIQSYKELFTIM